VHPTVSPPQPQSAEAPDLAGNKATARVLRVLTHLAEGTGSSGVSELSRELGMTKNMVYRALTTLQRQGFVIRDETGARYQLGPGVVRLGGTGLPDLNLPELCEPFMRSMRDLSGETVTLAVPSGRMAVIVLGYRGRGVIARRVPLGRVIALHVSPAARAILAHFPDEAIERYLEEPLERYTRATLADADAVWREVAAVRERGHATSFDDHWRGGRGVAFPVLGGGEFPHGAITVAGPAERLSEERLAELMPELELRMDQLNRYSRLYPSDYSGEAAS
jgi:DNA-binding IclR family transcriptional regulator